MDQPAGSLNNPLGCFPEVKAGQTTWPQHRPTTSDAEILTKALREYLSHPSRFAPDAIMDGMTGSANHRLRVYPYASGHPAPRARNFARRERRLPNPCEGRLTGRRGVDLRTEALIPGVYFARRRRLFLAFALVSQGTALGTLAFGLNWGNLGRIRGEVPSRTGKEERAEIGEEILK